MHKWLTNKFKYAYKCSDNSIRCIALHPPFLQTKPDTTSFVSLEHYMETSFQKPVNTQYSYSA